MTLLTAISRPLSVLSAVSVLLASAQADLVISEFVALTDLDDDRQGGYEDDDGQFSDWIEIHNSGDETIALSGYGLTDDPDDLDRWKFSSNFSIDAGDYLVVWASGKNKSGLFITTPHTNFKLDRSAGGYLALIGPEGEVLDEIADYPKQYRNISYGHDGYMTNPTPGEPNGASLGVPSTDVVFEVTSQTFRDSIDVTLTAPNLPEGAEIRYTVDNRVPTKSLFNPARLYEGPITIDATTQVRARVFEDGKLPSEVMSETFVKVGDEVEDWTSNLPVMIVEDFGVPRGSIPDNRLIPASWLILEPEGADGAEKRTSLLQAPTLSTRAGIRRRGSSTVNNAKMSLAVESWQDDADFVDRVIEPLGLPAESDWVLSGRFTFDRALMRNPFIYEVFRSLGHYGIRTRFVEVFANLDGDELEADDYYGVYAFMEKIKRGPDRVNIHDAITSGNRSGGYMLKVDRTSKAGGERQFSAGGQGSIVWVDPEDGEVTPQQEDWIIDYLNDMADAMRSDDPENPETGYRAFIDTRSWIDEHMIRMFTKDPDGLRLSTYLFKPMNGKICYGPIWDFDRTMGNDSDDRALRAEGWNPSSGVDYFTYTWFNNLIGNAAKTGGPARVPDFWQEYIDRWQQVRRHQMSTETMHGIIDRMAAEIAEGAERNFERWTQVRPVTSEYNNGKTGWEGEVEHLKGWVQARAEWIDDQFVTGPGLTPSGGLVEAGTEVTVKTGGTLFSPQMAYYRTDLGDPRASGGSLSPDALLAEKTVTIDATTSFTMRSRQGEQWSGRFYTAFVVDGIPASTEHLLISEIMYKPNDGDTDEQAVGHHFGEAFEFIEFVNAGDKTMYLGDVSLTEGVTFWFSESPLQVLEPGERLVIVSNEEAFRVRYGDEPVVAGQFIGRLDNGGETLTVQRSDEVIHQLQYDDRAPWPETPDELGVSLVLRDPVAGTDLNDASGWTTEKVGGSPGSAGSVPPLVYVNEVLANSGPEATDAVELWNPGSSEVDVSGWYLSDDANEPAKFVLPEGSVIPAGGYLVFFQDDDNDDANNDQLGPEYFGGAFGLASDGESIFLSSASADGALTGYRDGFSFGYAPEGSSFGRQEAGDGRIHHFLEKALTLGEPNAGAQVGPVVMTEIFYNPQGEEPDEVEYLELANVTDEAVDLFDSETPVNTWSIEGIDFVFPQNTTLDPGAVVLVVSQDPETFRNTYGIAAEVPIFGPFAGRLDNAGETIRLLRPGNPFMDQGSLKTPFYAADVVDYQEVDPWPEAADGGGASLERIDTAALGDDATNWRALPGGSPGRLADSTGGTDGPDVTTWKAAQFTSEELADPSISGLHADPDGDGWNNFLEYFLNGNAKAAEAGERIAFQWEQAEGEIVGALRFPQRQGAEVQVTLQSSPDLVNWAPVAAAEKSVTDLGSGTDEVVWRDVEPIAAGSPRFLRLHLEQILSSEDDGEILP